MHGESFLIYPLSTGVKNCKTSPTCGRRLFIYGTDMVRPFGGIRVRDVK
jgi:hypothetical protein